MTAMALNQELPPPPPSLSSLPFPLSPLLGDDNLGVHGEGRFKELLAYSDSKVSVA